MIVNKNQLGRQLLERLVDEKNVDMQVAMRFFYNSDFYASVPEGPVGGDIETLYTRFKHEFECAEQEMSLKFAEFKEFKEEDHPMSA